MNAYSDEGNLVCEPFAGSGTSLIAGERTGRKVHAIELAPEYTDISILRWRLVFPDAPVTLAEDGRTFEEVAAERGVEVVDAA